MKRLVSPSYKPTFSEKCSFWWNSYPVKINITQKFRFMFGRLKTLWVKEKMLVTSVFCFPAMFLNIFIRPSKTGRIMGSSAAGGRPGGRRPVLCPEHIPKTTLARVMKFHGWIDLIQGECSAQES